jgi:hypothetical protein
MSEQISETRACDLLAQVFKARGYAIKRNLDFHEYGVSFHIDGWDAKARVGFEFLSSEDDDHDDLSLKEYQTLMDAQQRGELSLFIIDEVEPLSSVDLLAEADDFLDEVADAVAARAGRRPARARPAAKPVKAAAKKLAKRTVAKPVAKKAASKTAAVSRPTAKKVAATKPAARKPAPKKAARKLATRPTKATRAKKSR